ncbi:MAG TPA: ABC transporter permease [Drouetiella sp.]
MNWRIIRALIIKYAFVVSRNTFRLMDLFFWPVLDLVLWGMVTIYMMKVSNGAPALVTFLIAAIILWNVLYRAQQLVSVSFLDDVWSRNLLNIFGAPIRASEYIGASFIMGLMQATLVLLLLGTLALFLHSLNIFSLGFMLAFFFVNLLFMGWSLGLLVTGAILKWGPPAEALAWAVPGLVQPLSAVFYPVSVLPGWLQPIALCFPASHVFEGMRQILAGHGVDQHHLWCAVLLNIVYMFASGWAFKVCLEGAKARGFLVKYGT